MQIVVKFGSSLFRVGRSRLSGQPEIELAGEQIDDGL